MRLPRNLSGDDRVKAMEVLGYHVTRQVGSHLRLTTSRPSEHHITIPRYSPLRTGTLSAILRDVAAQHGMTRDELIDRLFS